MPAKKGTSTSSQKPLLPTDKIQLPAFLKMLTDGGISMKNAMAVAAKVYKAHSTGEQLAGLNNVNLVNLGIGDKELRRGVLTAIKHAGYTAPRPTDRNELAQNLMERHQKATDEFLKPSSPSKKRKRTRDDDMFLPTALKDEAASLPSFDYKENKNEAELVTRSVVVNRAPVMMAWAAVVAEKLGFTREEALSIASVYTEMNATARGVATGIYEKGKEKGMEPDATTAQPHVELMGRRWEFALIQTENEQWRGLMKGFPVSPAKAYSYITRSFAPMTPYFMGALLLLAEAYSDPQALNRTAYSVYCDFRPESERWGGKGAVKLAAILTLRPGPRGNSMQTLEAENAAGVRSGIAGDQPQLPESAAECAQNSKKRKVVGDKMAEGQLTEDGLDQEELAQFMADLDEMDDGDET